MFSLYTILPKQYFLFCEMELPFYSIKVLILHSHWHNFSDVTELMAVKSFYFSLSVVEQSNSTLGCMLQIHVYIFCAFDSYVRSMQSISF